MLVSGSVFINFSGAVQVPPRDYYGRLFFPAPMSLCTTVMRGHMYPDGGASVAGKCMRGGLAFVP